MDQGLSERTAVNDTVFDWWSAIHFLFGIIIAAVLWRFIMISDRKLWYVFTISLILHQLWEIFENDPKTVDWWNHSNLKSIFSGTVLEYDTYVGDSSQNTAADTLLFMLGVSAFTWYRIK